MINFEKKLKDKKIFVTGHTGFTGSWVCLWLQKIGSEILGYSLPSHTSPSLFKSLHLDKNVNSIYGDVCNYELIKESIIKFQPDLILHLAAQPLVSKGYEEPLKTFNTNIIGTSNILEISRYVKSLKGVLCITTDKVYKNFELQKKYIETDSLGGVDPYSASKSAAEIIVESYAKSYFYDHNNFPIINVARGGNIIGGGDWSKDRLFPDYVRSITSKNCLNIRSLLSIRPWHHVLDLVSGYFLILSNILDKKINDYNAWNLGPHENQNYTVEDILKIISDQWEKPKINLIQNPIKETKTLTLNSEKAKKELSWEPAWCIKQSIELTTNWYKNFYADPTKAPELCHNDLKNWECHNFN